MSLVPDDILEELKCDYCHKYLSVGPVRIIHGKKICGRCADDKKDGALSLYNLFGCNAIFKCINRFDSCCELLGYNQIMEHENKCMSRYYFCPLCQSMKKMPAYQLIYHFKKNHGQYFLAKPFVKTEINQLEARNIFLYLKENYAFFIYVKLELNNKMFLIRASYIGECGKLAYLKQKYYLQVDRQRIVESEENLCFPMESLYINPSSSLYVDDVSPNSCVMLHFDFSCQISNISLRNTIITKEIETPSVKSRTRRIQIEPDHLKTVEDLKISVSTCGTKLIKNDCFELYLECQNCAVIGKENIFITFEGSVRTLICTSCIPVCRTNHQSVNECIKSFQLVLDYLLFPCIWNCGSLQSLEAIYSHELYCSDAPSIKCHYDTCYFYGQFANLASHLRSVHHKCLFHKDVSLSWNQNKLFINNSVSSHSEFCIWIHSSIILDINVTIEKLYNSYTIQLKVCDIKKEIKTVLGVVFKDGVFSDSFKNSYKFRNDKLPLKLHFITN